jgi:uncharacterized protein with PIN domain
MLLASVNPLDVLLFVGKQLMVIGGIYITIILLMRFSEYYRIKKCPECGHRLKRSSRSSSERTITSISLGMLPLKRYRCYKCYWEGAAFEIPGQKAFNEGKEETEEVTEDTLENGS